MNIFVVDDYEQLSKKAAQVVAQRVQAKKNLVLGLATGSTPVGMYQELVRMHENGLVNFGLVTTFNLDEYVGLGSDDSQSYYRFMQANFFSHVKVEKSFIPNGLATDFVGECSSYEAEIKSNGGIDVQILGVGRDGHIGFNEPGASRSSRTCVVSLDAITMQDNSRFFADISRVPNRAITMGIGTILDARECILLANGAHKAEIILRALKGPVTELVPASFLQTHENLTVILDKDAAKKIISCQICVRV